MRTRHVPGGALLPAAQSRAHDRGGQWEEGAWRRNEVDLGAYRPSCEPRVWALRSGARRPLPRASTENDPRSPERARLRAAERSEARPTEPRRRFASTKPPPGAGSMGGR